MNMDMMQQGNCKWSKKAVMQKSSTKPYARGSDKDVSAMRRKLRHMGMSSCQTSENSQNPMFQLKDYNLKDKTELMDTSEKSDPAEKPQPVKSTTCREEMHNGMVCTCGKKDYESQLEDLVGILSFDFSLGERPMSKMAQSMYN